MREEVVPAQHAQQHKIVYHALDIETLRVCDAMLELCLQILTQDVNVNELETLHGRI